jgi:hypothetical protein
LLRRVGQKVGQIGAMEVQYGAPKTASTSGPSGARCKARPSSRRR